MPGKLEIMRAVQKGRDGLVINQPENDTKVDRGLFDPMP